MWPSHYLKTQLTTVNITLITLVRNNSQNEVYPTSGTWSHRLYHYNSSCGNVMLSEVSVCLSTGGGVHTPRQTPLGQTHPPWADTPLLGRHPSPGQTPLPWADTPRQTPPPGSHPSGRHPIWADPAPEMATAEGGTYPTELHSCFLGGNES